MLMYRLRPFFFKFTNVSSIPKVRMQKHLLFPPSIPPPQNMQSYFKIFTSFYKHSEAALQFHYNKKEMH